MGEWVPKGIGLPQQPSLSWAAVVIYANLRHLPQGLVLDKSYQLDVLLTLLDEARRHNLTSQVGPWKVISLYFLFLAGTVVIAYDRQTTIPFWAL